MPEPAVVIALALVHRKGRWLVARRLPDAHLPNVWEFPGGKRHDGETIAAAAVRELLEECGVRARAGERVEVVQHRYPDRAVELHAVICEWESGEGEPLACAECRWAATDELANFDFPPANAPILAAMRRYAAAPRSRPR